MVNPLLSQPPRRGQRKAMSIIYQTSGNRPLPLQDVEQPQLYRELFPYTSICRTAFDDVLLAPRPAEQMRITDTTFRDGQQARPPYTVKQVAKMFDFLHRLGGKSGLITASEFFLYSAKDRKCIDVCRARGYRFPRVTAWIRANKEDLKLARDMEFDETGMLTSVSDYHIFLKLGKTRQQALDMYVGLAEQALEWGIIPRCHFEDVTRADIYGFCLPLAQRLMELSHQSGMPVKIRLCDTMGYGVPYPGAGLPRSVQRIVRAFIDDAETIRYGQLFQRIICLTAPFISITMLSITCFQSVGKKLEPSILSLLRKGGLDIPFMFIMNAMFAPWIVHSPSSLVMRLITSKAGMDTMRKSGRDPIIL